MTPRIKGLVGRVKLHAQLVGVFVFVACGYLFPRATRLVARKATNKRATRKADDAATPILRPTGQAEPTDFAVPGAPGGARHSSRANAAVEAIEHDRQPCVEAASQRQGAAHVAGRRPGAILSAWGFGAGVATCIVGGSICGGTVDAATASMPYVVVEYADTLQGTEAMFAVRVCASNEVAVRRTGGGSPATPPLPLESPSPVYVRAPAVGSAFIRESIGSVPGDIVVRVVDVDGREISRHSGVRDVCGYARIAAAFVVNANAAALEDAR